jgi:regulator of sigma E protease
MPEILSSIIGIISFILVLGLIVLVHEFGHFYFAKKAGILCHEFAIGMGPVIWQKKKGETMYSIRAIPIGGFVSMSGEEVESNLLTNINEVRLKTENGYVTKIITDIDNHLYIDEPRVSIVRYDLIGTAKAKKDELYIEYRDDDGKVEIATIARDAVVVFEKNKEIQIAPYDRSFANKSVSARFKTILAGPSMNFILAIVLFFLIGILTGFPVLSSNQVRDISENTPIHDAGLRDFDKIAQIGTFEITKWEDISNAMLYYRDNYVSEIPLTYVRDGQTVVTTVKPQVLIYSTGLVSDFTNDTEVVLGNINPRTLAGNAGFLKGDKILEIKIGSNITIVQSWQDVIDAFVGNPLGNEVEVKVDRDNIEKSFTFLPYDTTILEMQGLPIAKLQLGVSPIREFSLIKSAGYAFTGTASAFTLIFDTLRLLFTNNRLGIKDLSGPLGILTMTTDVAKQGFVALLNWTAILSVNVGFINLLPIPALDGSRLAFLGVEAVSKKTINKKIENIIHTVGLVALMLLFVFVTWNDLVRWIQQLIGVN